MSSSNPSHHIFFKTGFHIQLESHNFGRQICQLGLWYVCLAPALSAKFTSMCHWVNLLCGYWEIWTQILRLVQRALCPLSHVLGPYILGVYSKYFSLIIYFCSITIGKLNVHISTLSDELNLNWMWFLQRIARLWAQHFSQLCLLQCDIDLVLNLFLPPFLQIPHWVRCDGSIIILVSIAEAQNFLMIENSSLMQGTACLLQSIKENGSWDSRERLFMRLQTFTEAEGHA